MNRSNVNDLLLRNRAVERAFHALLKTVKCLIASQEDEYHRSIVEIDHTQNGNAWAIHELISPQFYLMLERDPHKCYWLSFGIDNKNDRLLSSKFLRLVFEQTKRTRYCNIEDCIRLDHIFLNAEELFEIAAMNQPIKNIDILDLELPRLYQH